MCGIAGIVVSERRRRDIVPVVRRIKSNLIHRGPDDRGLFVSDGGRCALAHTRLSILDLSPAGHQPMSSAGGRYQIVFNGEIYNYRELREELSREHGAASREPVHPSLSGQSADRTQGTQQTQFTQNPPTWKSNSDTEVILSAFERWGIDCLQRLRGMFSFAIWDEQEQELFLARDPLGIKPLYCYQTERCFLFASEVRALLASDLVPRKLSQEGLFSYLQVGSVQDSLTIVDGVHSLLPGHCLVVRRCSNRIETREFPFQDQAGAESRNAYRFALGNPPSTRPKAVKLLRAKLEDSIRAHLVSDVPVGAFLSGGIDSSAIVALMSRVTDKTPKTFSVVFKEAEFSEGEHAKLIARKFGTDHREILLSELSLLDMLPRAFHAMDQPTMDGINTYVVSKAVKDSGVTVALSGLGGDELFAGYPSFRRAMHLRRLAIAPSAMRRLASTAGRAILNGSVGRRKLWDTVESDCSPYSAYAISRQLFAPAEIAALTRGQRSEARGRQELEIRDQMAKIGKSAIGNPRSEIERDVINVISRYELTGYMANTLLRDTDQMSMAHALEVRVPFVDQEVIKYVLALPGEWKIDGGRPKPLLVDALSDLLPETIWKRPKMGFTLPFQRWMHSALQTDVDETFSSRDGLRVLGLHSGYARSLWDSFKENPQNQPWSRPWALYVLKKWCELNDVKT